MRRGSRELPPDRPVAEVGAGCKLAAPRGPAIRAGPGSLGSSACYATIESILRRWVSMAGQRATAGVGYVSPTSVSANASSHRLLTAVTESPPDDIRSRSGVRTSTHLDGAPVRHRRAAPSAAPRDMPSRCAPRQTRRRRRFRRGVTWSFGSHAANPARLGAAAQADVLHVAIMTVALQRPAVRSCSPVTQAAAGAARRTVGHRHTSSSGRARSAKDAA